MAVVEDGALVGTVCWHWVQWGPNVASRRPMIGIWLAQSARGRGREPRRNGSWSTRLFRHLPEWVEAHTDVANLAEQRAPWSGPASRWKASPAEPRMAHRGCYHDGILYSILRQESRRAARAD